MNFLEALTTMLQRPDHLAVLGDKRVIAISRTGFLMDLGRVPGSYASFRAAELLAVTWECWTPEMLEKLVHQEPVG